MISRDYYRKSVSLQRILQQNKIPVIIPVKDGIFKEINIKSKIHIGEVPIFDKIRNDHAFYDTLKYNSFEELCAINLNIPSGETKSIIIVVRFNTIPEKINQYFINLALSFNNGFKYDLSKFIGERNQKLPPFTLPKLLMLVPERG